jgi:hypothetical protein
MSLSSAAKLSSLSTELPRLDATIGGLVLHVRFLASSIEQIEERLLVETVNGLKANVLVLSDRLADVTTEIETLRRSGAGRSSEAGRFSSASGQLRHVRKGLADLESELRTLGVKAEARLNAPGRYGDASTGSGPIFELISLLQNVGDAVAKALNRWA